MPLKTGLDCVEFSCSFCSHRSCEEERRSSSLTYSTLRKQTQAENGSYVHSFSSHGRPLSKLEEGKSRALDRKTEQDRAQTPERNKKKYKACKDKIMAQEMQQYVAFI